MLHRLALQGVALPDLEPRDDAEHAKGEFLVGVFDFHTSNQPNGGADDAIEVHQVRGFVHRATTGRILQAPMEQMVGYKSHAATAREWYDVQNMKEARDPGCETAG